MQHPNQHRRPRRALQRMGRRPRPPRLRRQHHHGLPPPRPPLLPRRHRRHPAHALAARIHGPQAGRPLTAHTRLAIRIAKLRDAAALSALHTAQWQLQPGPQLTVSVVRQPAWKLCRVVEQFAVFAEHKHGKSAVPKGTVGVGDEAVELWWNAAEQQFVWRQFVERDAWDADAVDGQGEREPEQQVAV